MERTIDRLRAEFLEMPGLRLTVGQVQRLCGVDAEVCQSVLNTLVNVKFLQMNSDSTYARFRDDHHARPAKADLKTWAHRFQKAS